MKNLGKRQIKDSRLVENTKNQRISTVPEKKQKQFFNIFHEEWNTMVKTHENIPAFHLPSAEPLQLHVWIPKSCIAYIHIDMKRIGDSKLLYMAIIKTCQFCCSGNIFPSGHVYFLYFELQGELHFNQMALSILGVIRSMSLFITGTTSHPQWKHFHIGICIKKCVWKRDRVDKRISATQ